MGAPKPADRHLMLATISQLFARWRSGLRPAAMAGAFMLAIAAGSADIAVAQSNASKLNQLQQRDIELDAARAEQKRAAETEARIKRELEAIGDDRRKLNQALLDTAAHQRNLEGRIVGTEIRLNLLATDEQKMRDKLNSRRAVMIEVLAAMQRIGRHPPPAVIVSAEDALGTVRTAIMLGAVMPEMRGQAEKLAADLTALVKVRKSINDEQDRLKADVRALSDERQRTARLIEERQKQQAVMEKELLAEKQRATDLAREVDNLKDLIARLEKGLDRVTRAARALRDSRPEMAALRDPGRLSPAVAFASLRGHLLLPVNGVHRWRGKRHIDCGGGRRPGREPVRWMGGLCRGFPQLRPSLDPRCRWRLSCCACRNGANFCRRRAIRANRRTGRSHGK
jgi:septal ring factor EnvC (AmiA/AmiB activator)